MVRPGHGLVLASQWGKEMAWRIKPMESFTVASSALWCIPHVGPSSPLTGRGMYFCICCSPSIFNY